jgi:hypothetical protein
MTIGQDLISEPFRLEQGNYNLENFVVLNDLDEAIYISPIVGSAYAALVDRPLPINFSVNSGANTVTPQVLTVSDTASAPNFGYVSFSFEIVGETGDIDLNILRGKFQGCDSSISSLGITDLPVGQFVIQEMISLDSCAIDVDKEGTVTVQIFENDSIYGRAGANSFRGTLVKYGNSYKIENKLTSEVSNSGFPKRFEDNFLEPYIVKKDGNHLYFYDSYSETMLKFIER